MLSCIYWFFALTGGTYIILTTVVGEISDAGHHLVDGIGDHIENFLEGAIHALTGHFIDLDGHHFEVHNGPGPFSFRTMLMFLTGFGAGGLFGYGVGLPDLFTLIPAIGAGVVMGVVGYFFVRWLYNAQGSSDTNRKDYIGLQGTVVTSIPEGGVGRVGLEVKLQRKNVPAKSKGGKPIPYGTKIFIIEAEEGGVFVVDKNE